MFYMSQMTLAEVLPFRQGGCEPPNRVTPHAAFRLPDFDSCRWQSSATESPYSAQVGGFLTPCPGRFRSQCSTCSLSQTGVDPIRAIGGGAWPRAT